MEIRELYRDEVLKLSQAGREALGTGFPSAAEIGSLRENPLAFLPVAVAGTEIIGIALAELREDRVGRVGSVRLVTSFLGEEPVDRAVRMGLVSRLEGRFKELGVNEIELPGNQDLDFIMALKRAGYRPDAGSAVMKDASSFQRLMKRLRSAPPPWSRSSRANPAVIE